jgi:hypothetical protein
METNGHISKNQQRITETQHTQNQKIRNTEYRKIEEILGLVSESDMFTSVGQESDRSRTSRTNTTTLRR